eukprot:9497818-Heterocapsa_arctica.AAC.1
MTQGQRRVKLDDRFLTGLYLGLVERSDAVVIGTPLGCYRVRSIRRLQGAQRSSPYLIEGLT